MARRADFSRFAGEDGSGKLEGDPIAPFTPGRPDGYWMAWDPSLTACGWVWIQLADGKPIFLDCGVIHCDAEAKTQLGKMQASAQVNREAWSVLFNHRHDGVIMETPAAPRPGMTYSDAPILAASAIYSASRANALGMPVELHQAQQAKVRWCDNRKASKAQIRKAMLALHPEITKSLGRPKRPVTEAVYDAIALGLYALEHPYKEA